MTTSDAIDGRLAIGLPVWNGEEHLEAALRNLVSTDADVAIIVSDNASTDATFEIAGDLAVADHRISVVRHDENVGANRNFNSVVAHCDRPLFKWAAVDDLIEASLLERCVEALAASPDAVLAYGRPALIDDDGYPLAQQIDPDPVAGAPSAAARFDDVLRNEVWCTPVFGVIRHEVLTRTRLLRPFYGADKVLLSELATHGRFRRVDATFYRRCHDAQSTVLDAKEKSAWTLGSSSRSTPAVVQATAAYVQVARSAEVDAAQRLRMLASVGRTVGRLDRVKKALLPGPYNYFGWNPRGIAPYEGLDMSRVPGAEPVTA